MKSTLSNGRGSIVREKLGPAKWVQAVSKESQPPNLVEYSRQRETFFEEYAVRVEEWHRRNTGYHNAIASVARSISLQARVFSKYSPNGRRYSQMR